MKALVTGGGGFLGTRLARMLCERGEEVTVLGRRRYPHLEGTPIRCLQADIRDRAAVQDACRGMEVVFHAAAIPGIWGRRRTFQEINIEGTRNVLAACRAGGVRKLVHTSSPSVVFDHRDLCGVDESWPYPSRFLADYPATKAVAERLVLAANDDQLATVALRPHLIWGPGDPHLIPRVIARARTGRLVQVGDGTNLVDITYIDNAAEAHLRAAEALAPGSACAGRPYFISQGEPVKLWPWLRCLLERLGIPGPTRSIPCGLAYRLGAVAEAAYRLLRLPGEPRLTRFVAFQLAKSHYFDISAARRDFGYQPVVSTETGLDRLVAHLGGTQREFLSVEKQVQ